MEPTAPPPGPPWAVALRRELSSGRLGLFVAGSGALFLVVASGVFLGGPAFGYDYAAYDAAARRLAAGAALYQPLTQAGPFQPGPGGLYLYAPPLAAALLPLTALATKMAATVWLALKLGLLAAACALMPVPRATRLLTFGVAAVSPPVLVDLNLGNVGLVVLFLAVVAWRWLDRPTGSLAIAAALSLRPPLGAYLVWWALRRRWAPAAWTLLAALAVVSASLPIVGLDAFGDYVRLLSNLGDLNGVPNNVSLGASLSGLGLAEPVPSLGLLAGYGIAVGAVLVSLRRDPELGFVVTLGATLLAPLLWVHYLVGLLVPAAFLAARGRPWGLALPLLGWLPDAALPLAALAGTLAPFLAAAPSSSAVAGPPRPGVRSA